MNHQNSLELGTLCNHLWESANILRGPVDAADFKTYIFPLLFFKRISDVYDEEIAEALEESGGDRQYALFAENHRFQIPEDCHWEDVRKKTSNVGRTLQRAMREIEKANPDTLYGIFGDAQWTNKDRLSDALLCDLIEAVEEAKGRANRIAIKLIARLRGHAGDPKFVELGERLENLRERHEKGLDDSRKFLKEILRLARDVVAAEKETTPKEEQNLGKAALTELFEEVRNSKTPILVERIVSEIDEIVRIVRFDGWQSTSGGEREVKKALRKVLLHYKLHGDQELFDRAYGYIVQYY